MPGPAPHSPVRLQIPSPSAALYSNRRNPQIPHPRFGSIPISCTRNGGRTPKFPIPDAQHSPPSQSPHIKKKAAAAPPKPVPAAAKTKAAAALLAAAKKKPPAGQEEGRTRSQEKAAAPMPVPAAAKKKAAAAVPAAAKKEPLAAKKKSVPAAKKAAAAVPVPVPAVAKKKAAAAVPAAAKKEPLAAKKKAVPTAKKKAAAAVPAAKKKDVPAAKKKAVPAAKKKAATAAPAATKRASGGTAGCRPRKRARDDNCDGDLISNLPDAVLCTIISLLPTKDGARTQAIARRWRPLWRSAPLNLNVENLSTNDFKQPHRRRGPRPLAESIISRILSDHPGPVRRFDFRLTRICPKKEGRAKEIAQIESWLHSRSLRSLEELHIFFPILRRAAPYSLPSSLLRFASTVVVATIGYCDVPDEIVPSLNFPMLKHLTLFGVHISEDAFHGVLSACHMLESLSLERIVYDGSLHISSRTLRSICFSHCYMCKNELVIQNTPHLERLLCPCWDSGTIRVNRAPKLEILGPLSPCIFNLQIANLVFQGLIPTSMNNSICTVKVLALQFACTDLNAVLDVLRFFPCLEKLYVMWNEYLETKMNNVRHYDPLDPIKCLETHLKTLVLKNYTGNNQDVSFAKFFVLNAKVLNEIKFGVSEKFDEKWVADQHRLLGVESEASPEFEFKHCSYCLNCYLDTHDLSIADPFNNSFLPEDHTPPVISISCSSSSDEDSA